MGMLITYFTYAVIFSTDMKVNIRTYFVVLQIQYLAHESLAVECIDWDRIDDSRAPEDGRDAWNDVILIVVHRL